MIQYTTLKKKPQDLLALTGLARREFDELLPVFEQVLRQPRPSRRRRQRAPGGGRKPALPTGADKLLFILVYVKTYPLQAVQAQLFGMSQPSANRYIRQLLPVLAQALDTLGVMPARSGAAVTAAERPPAKAPDLIIDGVARRRQRPKRREKQALHYSGKQKAHADKNVVVVSTQTKQVNFLSQTLPGSVHDKRLADHADIQYRKHTTLRSDLGFVGYAPKVRAHLQPKKNRNAAR